MVKLVVLGANAFSATHFIQYAAARYATVLGISRSPQAKPPFAPYLESPHANSISFLQADINQDHEKIRQQILTFKPTHVVNFAAQGMVAPSWENPLDWYQTNIVSSVRLIEFLKNCDFLERYLQISTPEVYGSSLEAKNEGQQFSPSTPYALSKACLDDHLRISGIHQDFPVMFARSANFYGPGQQLYRVIPKAMLSFLNHKNFYLQGNGQSQRSFIHIEDVVNGYWKALTEGELGGVYHFASPQLISVKDLVYKIADLVEENLDTNIQSLITSTPDRLGKDSAYTLSTAQTRKALGWSPQISLDLGLAQTLNWVNTHLLKLNTLPWDYIHQS